MKRVAFLLLAVLALVLSSCAVVAGKVIDKEYTEPYNTIGYNHVGKVLVPYTIHHSATWDVKLDGMTQKGKHVQRWMEVTHYFYDKIQVGDRYDHGSFYHDGELVQ